MDQETPETPDPAEVRETFRRLGRQVALAHYMGIALTVAFGLFIFRLQQFQRKSIASQAQVTQTVVQELARMNTIVGELRKYGATHADYAAILKKYGLEPMTDTNAAAKPAGR